MGELIEEGKNITNAEYQTRIQERFDPIARRLVPTVGLGWWDWHCPQKRQQYRSVTITYEWTIELVANGSGSPPSSSSWSDESSVTSGCDVLEVLPSKDVVKLWTNTIEYDDWAPTGESGWEDSEPIPGGWMLDV